MTEVTITVDLSAAEPPYEQVRTQVAGLVATGRLRAGDRLPTVRALAADLGLAGNTVARAYKELEAQGLVTTRRRTGTVVAQGTHEAAGDVTRRAAAYVKCARRSGLSEAAAVDLVRSTYRQAGA